MRVTVSMTQRTILDAIQSSYQKLSLYQRQTGTGKRIFDASDDPVGASRLLWLTNAIDELNQYQSNIDTALDELMATDHVFTNVLDRMLRVKEIMVNACNGLQNDQTWETWGYEVEEILREVVSYSNTTINDKYIFAGFQTTSPAFTATYLGGLVNTVTYNGDAGQRLIEVNTARTEIINYAGDNTADPTVPGAFIDANAPGIDIFAFLMDLRDNLFAGNQAAISTTDQADISRYVGLLENLEGQLAVKIQELEVLKESHDSQLLFKTDLRADVEEADFFTVASDMERQTMAYQSALKVGAQVIPSSLFDFLF